MLRFDFLSNFYLCTYVSKFLLILKRFLKFLKKRKENLGITALKALSLKRVSAFSAVVLVTTVR